MKSAVVRVMVAILLFAGCMLSLREARQVRDVSAAYERLATLRYDTDADLEQMQVTESRMPWQAAMRDEVEEHRAAVVYWRSLQSGALPAPAAAPAAPAAAGAEAEEEQSPAAMLAAANTLFRSAQRFNGDRRVAVERLDAVVRAYADVLRAAPDQADAAFNFEYVTKLRDTVARGRGALRSAELRPAGVVAADATDLPAGPTIHGLPGGPPPELPAQEFKTLVPKMQEEREEPGGGQRPPRRG